ncbi:hypothetical protein B5F40_10605 [Gordonibacter sp. An230]|uniref:hypothetical protein n=1 Tax=Gordonibacter sp. An230 TaxID=1965592 RepID=UPI000B3663DD|nr:hypothetical protein [Gordonibacter sp. An230]OUO89548.1 hypothetical protein B5F40_10605 [Gordonibacter sp. An230]
MADDSSDPFAAECRKAAKALADPAIFAAAAVAVTCLAFCFDAEASPLPWSLAVPLALICATLTVVQKRRSRKRTTMIGKKQAARCNNFEEASKWLPNRYLALIELEEEPTKADRRAAVELYCNLAECVVSLGLCERTGALRMDEATGREVEKAYPMELHTRVSLLSGRGYVLMEPFGAQKQGFERMDEGAVHRALRDCGFVGWDVEKVSYDDDVALFILHDASRSRAFNLSEQV